MRSRKAVCRQVTGGNRATGEQLTFTRHFGLEITNDISRAHFIILIATMQTYRGCMIMRKDGIVICAVPIRKTDGTFLRAEEPFRCENEGVVKTTADYERCGDLHRMIGISGPIGLELL